MRKQPQQQRSREMVARILTASTDLLRREGYDRFSTNRVARAAGVSPGSLYQYFPDKSALVAEVIDRWLAEASERVTAAMSDRVGLEGREMVRQVVEALVEALEADVALLRIVLVELPPARTRDSLLQLERRVQELLAAYVAGRMPGTDHATRAWVVVLTTEQLVVRWLVDGPDLTRQQLVDEVVALCTGYLSTAGPRGARRQAALPALEPVTGVEPATSSLQVRRSTN